MCCRQVRQESQLWTQLHQGLLTTGRLNAALGFYEPVAARRLGIPRDRVNHNALLSAIANLQMPAYGLQLLNTPAATVISVEASTGATVPQQGPQTAITGATAAKQGLQNAITVSEFEAEAIKLANAAAAAANGSKSKKGHKRMQRTQQQQVNGTHPASAAATYVPPTRAVKDVTVDPYAAPEARRKRCQLVATRGDAVTRCFLRAV